MSDGNKKQRNQFLKYLEDYSDIEEIREKENNEKKQWIVEDLDKGSHRKRFLGLVYVLCTVIFLGVLIFWWNVSRAKFYKALDNPFNDDQVQGFLQLLEQSKMDMQSDVDWKNQLNQIDESKLTPAEQATLIDLKQKVNDGANLSDLINEIK